MSRRKSTSIPRSALSLAALGAVFFNASAARTPDAALDLAYSDSSRYDGWIASLQQSCARSSVKTVPVPTALARSVSRARVKCVVSGRTPDTREHTTTIDIRPKALNWLGYPVAELSYTQTYWDQDHEISLSGQRMRFKAAAAEALSRAESYWISKSNGEVTRPVAGTVLYEGEAIVEKLTCGNGTCTYSIMYGV